MTGLWLALAFLSGILAHDLGMLVPALAAGALAIAAALAVCATRRARLLAVALGACALLGVARAATTPAPPSLPADAFGEVQFTATVASLPRSYPERTDAVVHLHRPLDTRAYAHVPPIVPLRQGDVLSGYGELVAPTATARRHDAAATLLVSRVEVVARDAGAPQRLRAWLQHSASTAILRAVPEPAASLVLGVLLGDDSRMAGTTRQAFIAAGLSHITAVSGWNVAIVAGVCEALLSRWLGVRGRTVLVLAAVWAYAYLVGLHAPVVRAASMASLYLAARWRGRPRDPVSALAWSVVALVAVTPRLRFDVAFQLSAIATAALALSGPQLARYPTLVSASAVPVIAQLAVTPLLLHHFGSYSLLAPVANVLVGPVVAPILFGGAAVWLLSYVHAAVAAGLGVLVWLPARWVVLVAETVAGIPAFAGHTVSPSAELTVLLYIIGAVPTLWWWSRATTVAPPATLALLAPEAAELSGPARPPRSNG